MIPRRAVRSALAVLASGLAGGLALAPAAAARPPAPSVHIHPNAIQDPREPMEVAISSFPPGASLELQILHSCADRLRAGPPGRECREPIQRWAPKLERGAKRYKGQVEPSRLSDLPNDVPLWLRTVVTTPDGSAYSDVLFSVGGDRCSAWSAVIQTFFGGECALTVARGLLRHWGAVGSHKTGEVYLAAIAEDAEAPEAVPGTRGATGVAWRDRDTLLVTQDTSDLRVIRPEDRVPGVFLLSRDGATRRRLRSSPEGSLPSAPYAGPGGLMYFVEGTSAGEYRLLAIDPAAETDGTDTGGSLKVDLALPQRVDRILAVDDTTASALLLARKDAEHSLIVVDLVTGVARSLGWSMEAYQAAVSSPTEPRAVLEVEDLGSNRGWDLVLVDTRGETVRTITGTEEDDQLPAWREDGAEIAFIRR